jgi:hypothetical protein
MGSQAHPTRSRLAVEDLGSAHLLDTAPAEIEAVLGNMLEMLMEFVPLFGNTHLIDTE